MSPYDKQVVLFDLDGTVVNSKQGIFNSIFYTLQKLKIEIPNEETLQSFIGPSIGASFIRHFGMSEAETQNAVSLYREYYAVQGIYEYTVYNGLTELLKTLCEQGKSVGLATKKPQPFAERVIDSAGLSPYFKLICGSGMHELHDDKTHIIKKCADELTNGDLSKAVHIGDTHYDVTGARGAGVDCIGVLYGFGSLLELQAENPYAIARDMTELYTILTKKPQ